METLRDVLKAWNDADVEAVLTHFHPECEVSFRPEVPEPGPFHGRDELRAWAEGFLQVWETTQTEIVEIVAADEARVVAKFHLTGRGTGSGLPMDLTWFNVFEFQGGKIIGWRDFDEREHALEAAGLSE